MNIHIRGHQARHAVRMSVRVQSDCGGLTAGLLIEISTQGCRISQIDDARIKPGSQIRVLIDGFAGFGAEVLRAHDGLLGLRFASPLSRASLKEILESYFDPPLRLAPLIRFAT